MKGLQKMNHTLTGKWHNQNQFMTALNKVDLRIESFKGRLEEKKKYKKGVV